MEENKDFSLIRAALNGNKEALNELIKDHSGFVYNLCQKMMYCPIEASDAAQEIWIKVITHLKTFEFRSKFSTWLYRIAVNHILNINKIKMESSISGGFANYGSIMDSILDEELNVEDRYVYNEIVEEAKFSCIMGMLICLNRDQRMAFVLGEIFKFDHKLGSALMEISEDNFRQKLSRARADISNFTNNRCSLINKNNPCKCRKKAKGFIERKYVDPNILKFNTNYSCSMKDVYIGKYDKLSDIKEEIEFQFFSEIPFQHQFDKISMLEKILKEGDLNDLLNFN
jgi:RNA polymerase sigma factor (sigma-70 family)